MPETKTRLDKRTKGLLPAGQYYATDTGAADAYVITLSDAPTAYETGRLYAFKAANANTGASTINVNSLGTKTIKKNTSSDLSAGDIAAGQIVFVAYDGTNMQLVSVFPGAGGSSTSYAPVYNTDYTYGETIAAGDNLYLEADTNKLKLITSDPSTWAAWVGVADEAGVNNDTGKRVIVDGLVPYGSFAAANPTFTQSTGGSNTILKDDTGSSNQDHAFAHGFQNNGADVDVSGAHVYLKKNNSPSGNVYVHTCLGFTSANMPAGNSLPIIFNPVVTSGDPVILHTQTINNGSITTSFQQFTWNYSSNIRVPAGATIWLVVTTDAAINATNNFVIESSSAFTIGYTPTLGGGAYRQWQGTTTGTSSGLKCGFTVVSRSQLGNTVRLYNGSTNGTASTGTSSMGFYNRSVGVVVSTSSWVIKRDTTLSKALYADCGTVQSGGTMGGSPTPAVKLTLASRPKRVEIEGNIIHNFLSGNPYNYYIYRIIHGGAHSGLINTLRIAFQGLSAITPTNTNNTQNEDFFPIPFEGGLYMMRWRTWGLYAPGISNFSNGQQTVNLFIYS